MHEFTAGVRLHCVPWKCDFTGNVRYKITILDHTAAATHEHGTGAAPQMQHCGWARSTSEIAFTGNPNSPI
jgi:hypothetical protein